MSTNYYFRTKPTQSTDDALHIGLSSGGYFQFRAYPRRALITRASWVTYLRGMKGEIVNERDEVVSLGDFQQVIALTPDDSLRPIFANSPVVLPGKPLKDGLRYRDAEGYLFGNYSFS